MAKRTVPASERIPRFMIVIGRALEFLSYRLAARYAAKLFTTPIRHKMPKREWHMDRESVQHGVMIRKIGKEVVVYHYGDGARKILLVHGWSGRGTQLVKIADAFRKAGYAVISFDAPAHGKSPGSTSIMPEFIAVIQQLHQEFGPFQAAVGHSLGGMSLLNAVKRGLPLQALVTIGSGDVIQDIIDEFTDQMRLSRKTGQIMRGMFERHHESMDDYSAYLAAQQADIPVLVIHDENDREVTVDRGRHIHQHLKHGELMITKGLGHRKILGTPAVVDKILHFIQTYENVSSAVDTRDRMQRPV